MTVEELLASQVRRYEFISQHESGHAAAGALLGLVPVEIEVVSEPLRTAGQVRFKDRPATSDAVVRKFALMVLGGWMATDEEPPGWPPDDEAAESDERALAALVQHLRLDKTGYAALTSEGWRLAASDEFGLVEHAIKSALRYRCFLDAEEIANLLLIALGTERTAELYGVDLDNRTRSEEAMADAA